MSIIHLMTCTECNGEILAYDCNLDSDNYLSISVSPCACQATRIRDLVEEVNGLEGRIAELRTKDEKAEAMAARLHHALSRINDGFHHEFGHSDFGRLSRAVLHWNQIAVEALAEYRGQYGEKTKGQDDGSETNAQGRRSEPGADDAVQEQGPGEDDTP